jgi:glycosyltransferase involved in cell wall biosynthesis
VTTVGVNLLWCVPGRVGGSEEYVTRALAPLPAAAPELEVVLFALPGFAAAHPEVAARHEVVTAPLTGRRRALRVVAERTWLAREATRRRLALVHHAGGTAPALPGVRPRVVLSMHDIQYVAFPQYFTRIKLAWLRRQVPAGLRRADVVTTPSGFVRDTLASELGVDRERVVVVPHGLPPDFASGRVDEDALRARYRLPGPFLLYPAATYPHKNHLLLLDVLARLRDRSDLRLVLTGGRGLGEDALVRAINRRGLRDQVLRTGRVPDADRDGLLRCADVVVFPSRYEGFGAPVLEAMAVGTPVVAAATTALPEVLGAGRCQPAGLLVDPDDGPGWAAAVARVLDDAELRARLITAGRVRAAELTNVQSARSLASAYRGALAR